MSRCFAFYCGKDYVRRHGFWMAGLGLFRRKAEPGEQRFRLFVELALSRRGIVWTVISWPAWWDEPTALAEFNRTMRGR